MEQWNIEIFLRRSFFFLIAVARPIRF